MPTPEWKIETAKQIAVLAAGFRVEADQALFVAFEYGLDGLSAADVKRAVARAIRECQFMPTPRELRDLSGELSGRNRAVLAWDAVKSAIEKHGGYRSVDFDDKIINACIGSMGGWPHVSEQETIVLDRDMWPRFQRLYEAFYARGSLSAAQAAPLLGLFDISNRANGFNETQLRIVREEITKAESNPDIPATAIDDLRRIESQLEAVVKPPIAVNTGLGCPLRIGMASERREPVALLESLAGNAKGVE